MAPPRRKHPKATSSAVEIKQILEEKVPSILTEVLISQLLAKSKMALGAFTEIDLCLRYKV